MNSSTTSFQTSHCYWALYASSSISMRVPNIVIVQKIWRPRPSRCLQAKPLRRPYDCGRNLLFPAVSILRPKGQFPHWCLWERSAVYQRFLPMWKRKVRAWGTDRSICTQVCDRISVIQTWKRSAVAETSFLWTFLAILLDASLCRVSIFGFGKPRQLCRDETIWSKRKVWAREFRCLTTLIAISSDLDIIAHFLQIGSIAQEKI